MTNSGKRYLVILVFALVGLGPFILYGTSGLSFYTYHALSGLMAIKYQIARCFLSGAYPRWNPLMLCGAPFHSGIGVLDPFLITNLFLGRVTSMLASAYLALCVAGLFMYLYLRKVWNFSITSSLLGGILYMTNPFFAATSHESPFMTPPVYLPMIFLCYEAGVAKKSLPLVLLSGMFLGFSFLSGNLESFYFVLVFFMMTQILRQGIRCFEIRSMSPFKTEIKWLALAIVSPFLFTAVDLFPTVEMIAGSGRNADATIVQNMILFLFVLCGSLSAVWCWQLFSRISTHGRGRLKWFIGVILFALFAVNVAWREHYIDFNRNLFFPDVKMIMFSGTDAFHFLMEKAPVGREALTKFLEPRFVFYIQPPIYLFTLATLILFIKGFVGAENGYLRGLAVMAFLVALFPYTAVPNLLHFFLHLDQIAYPRVMFAFFYIVSILAAFGFEKVSLKTDGPGAAFGFSKTGILLLLCGILGLGLTGSLLGTPFRESQFRETVPLIGKGVGGISGALSLTWLHGQLTFQVLRLFFHENGWIFLTGVLKYVSLIFLALAVAFRKVMWRYLLVLSLTVESILCWNLYTFQTRDIRLLTQPFPETEFLKQVGTDERIAVRKDPRITLENFYDTARPLDLNGNFSSFWNVKSIEGATLNLSPELFRRFWAIEPKNSYTPTMIFAVPSKIYDLMGMNYLYSDLPISDESYEKVIQGKRYDIYKNRKALPRFYFAHDIARNTDEEIKKSIAGAGWDPLQVTLIDNSVAESSISLLRGSGVQHRLGIVHEEYNRLILASESSGAEFLATTDAYHKNWKVYVDGALEPVVRTNYYFRGLFLRPGTHTIDFRYDPVSYEAGLAISLLSLIALAWTFFSKRKMIAGLR